MSADRNEYQFLPEHYPDLSAESIAIIKACLPFTLTSPDRLHAQIEAVRYICTASLPGAIVECGVWKGGSMMAAALTILAGGFPLRDLYLFDTFAGMPKPGGEDIDLRGEAAMASFERFKTGEDTSSWAYAPLEVVKRAMLATGYAEEKIHFIQGKVEQTLPDSAPEQVAVLRLDTDWYESTRHELLHLYPRLVTGGALIIDDYGHFQGARKATDEFFQQRPVLLNRIDYSARIAIKV